jgi:YidC/Oxa1 family membrane protein insertase
MSTIFYNLVVLVTSVVPGHYVWVSIVVITILLRLIFVKSTYGMLKTQHKQKGLQGELSKIKETHKADPKAQQQATMDLYKREGVNPLGSCLPMIVQIVLLIGFYSVFTKIGIGGEVKANLLYSFVPHLASLNSHFFGIDLALKVSDLVKLGGTIGIVSYLFPILTGGSQLWLSILTKQMQPKNEPGKQPDFASALNTQMMYIFPIMTAYISFTLPSALSIYWIVQTVFMAFQQQMIMKKLKEEEIITEEVAEVLGAKKLETYNKGGVVVTVKEKK